MGLTCFSSTKEAMADGASLKLCRGETKMPYRIFFNDLRRVFKNDDLAREILRIAVPTALGLTADPIASLIDTAFIGHIGPVELAAVGVSIALFNQISKVAIYPLVSITTSYVAEEETMARVAAVQESENENDSEGNKTEKLENKSGGLGKDLPRENEMIELEKGNAILENALPDDTVKKESAIEPENALPEDTVKKELIVEPDSGKSEHQSLTGIAETNNTTNLKPKKKYLSSASSAMVIGAFLGVFQALFLIFTAKPLLHVMGVKAGSPMLTPAMQYLQLRSLGSPAILLSLAMQGIFRGFKDTKTPLYAIVAADVANIILDPIFIYVLHMGVRGAAIAHILSQYLMAVILLLILMKKIHLLPPRICDLPFGRFLRNGSFLLARVVAATFCVTLAASMAARLGPIPMAAFQISMQVWLATSLLADGLAVAGQTILASAFAEKNYEKAAATAARVLQHSVVLGAALCLFIGLGLQFGSGIFTKNKEVQRLISISIPFVACTQPINSLAFVFDGVNFGASDFTFSAYSMILVAILSIISLVLLSHSNGFIGIWVALTVYISLRMFAGIWRMGTGTRPWRFLKRR